MYLLYEHLTVLIIISNNYQVNHSWGPVGFIDQLLHDHHHRHLDQLGHPRTLPQQQGHACACFLDGEHAHSFELEATCHLVILFFNLAGDENSAKHFCDQLGDQRPPPLQLHNPFHLGRLPHCLLGVGT